MRTTSIALAATTALLTWACGGGEEAGRDDVADRMAEEHEGDRPVAAAAADGGTPQAVEGREVQYATVGGQEVTGYLAAPEGAPADVPGVIVIHEWWGLNDNIRAMADRLAGEGYAALAVDLYHGESATTPEGARELVGAVDEQDAKDNLRQAYDYLDERGAPRIGAIGWCFGGGWSLQTALLHPKELDADVIYYGRLITTPDVLEALEMPVMGHFGAEDSSIPPDAARAFERVLNQVGVTNHIYVYEGAGHAFANPSGERYVPEAARQAWERTRSFLAEHLKGGGAEEGMGEGSSAEMASR